VGAAVREDGGAHDPVRGAQLPGAASSSTDFSPEAAQRVPDGSELVATARGASLRVFARPAAAGRGRTLHARRIEGRRIPLVLLVKRRRDDWVQVYLPTRPNGSTGWLRTREVALSATAYRIDVRLRRHRLILWKGGRVVVRAKIAKGRAVSPTPTGRYFVTDLLRPPDPRGFFGPYALGLSAHSPVYTSFAGGDGQVGLHGTNQPSVLGHDVSHGCIRVANDVITKLAERVPLGSPVDISRA
jgi:lipoprotein-anchoring transpeptidase ErfK/SrfK